MRGAARFHEYGDPEVLVIEEVPIPTPGAGDVLVTVRAAGVNPVEWKIRRGAREVPLPAGLGSDVAGVVDAVGAWVTEVSAGDEVFGVSTTPSYAEYALAKPSQLACKPATVPWAMRRGAPMTYRRDSCRALVPLHPTHTDAHRLLALHMRTRPNERSSP